jgi:hypothetical protein
MKPNRDTEKTEKEPERVTLKTVFVKGIFPFFNTLYQGIKLFNQRWNEAWLMVLGFLLWKYSDYVLSYVDPTAVPLPVNDLMRFLYATIGTCVVHFFVSVMLRLSHPLVFRYLYSGFYYDLYNESPDLKSSETKNQNRCNRLKYSLLVWLLYLATWLVLVATF